MVIAPNSSAERSRVGDVLLWALLAFAFSPVLAELIPDAYENYPFAWSLLVAPVMLARVVSSGEERDAHIDRRLGVSLIGIALLVQLLGMAGGAWSIARAGIPLAILGMAYWTGAIDPMAAALSVWMLPIPTFLFVLTTPNLESQVAEVAAAIYRALGGEVHLAGPRISSASYQLKLSATDSGLHLLVLMALMGWYSALRKCLPLRGIVLRALLVSLFAAPLQLVGLVIAISMTARGAPEAAETWLTTGMGLGVVAVGLLLVEWRERPHDEPLPEAMD